MSDDKNLNDIEYNMWFGIKKDGTESEESKKINENIKKGKSVIVKKSKKAKKSNWNESIFKSYIEELYKDAKSPLSYLTTTGSIDKIDTGQYTWNVPQVNVTPVQNEAGQLEYKPMGGLYSQIIGKVSNSHEYKEEKFEPGDIVRRKPDSMSPVSNKLGVIAEYLDKDVVLVSWIGFNSGDSVYNKYNLFYGPNTGWTTSYTNLEMVKKGKDNVKENEKDQIKLNHPKVIFKNDKLGDLYELNKIGDWKPIYGYKLDKNKFLIYEDVKIIEGKKLSYKFKIYKSSEFKHNYHKIGESTINRFYSNAANKNQAIIKNIEDSILLSSIVLIKKCEESIKSFGFGPTKRQMVGNYYKIDNISYNVLNKETNKNESIITIKNEKLGKSLKFYLSDVEIIIPDPTSWLKSYNLPKDRTIKIGSNVKLVNNKNLKLEKNTQLLVHAIKGEKQYITVPKIDKNVGIRLMIDKINPNCPVICKNDKGESFKLRMKQIKVI